MPLVKDTIFESDQIEILIGFNGAEHKNLMTWCLKYKAEFPSRIAFAVNQHYPELASGFYRNKRLEAMVQEAMLSIGLHVVIWDNHRKDGVVPEEPLGSLETVDDYLLVDESLQIRGRLNVWQDLGSKSRFYHDQLILEVVTDESRGKQLVEAVMQNCQGKSASCAISN